MLAFKDLRPYPPKYPVYPPYSNIEEYIEHYFYNFFINNKDLFSDINRQYIPIFWTTLYNDNVQINVQEYLNALPQNKKYFTINQHDDGIRQILPTDTIVFSASENGHGKIFPIPLLTSPIKNDDDTTEKDILCSFVGTITHPIRINLFDQLKDKKGFYFSNPRNWSPVVSHEQFDEFKSITKRSKFSLCPRGNIIQSFRLYEIFQLKSVPVIVTDAFTYPFKKYLNWDEIAVIVHYSNIKNIPNILNEIDDDKYISMIKKGQEAYRLNFTLDKMILNIIEILKNEN
jgi:hypothetical protein